MNWFYSNVTREAFEKRKDYIQTVMLESGAQIVDIKLPYEQKNISINKRFIAENRSVRPAFIYKDEYFRVSEVLFEEKPFIVLECGTRQDLLNNTMEDADPFPYDLPDKEIRDEARYVLGIS